MIVHSQLASSRGSMALPVANKLTNFLIVQLKVCSEQENDEGKSSLEPFGCQACNGHFWSQQWKQYGLAVSICILSKALTCEEREQCVAVLIRSQEGEIFHCQLYGAENDRENSESHQL